MNITNINKASSFKASFSTFGKIQYMIRLHRFPKAAKTAMEELRSCECDYVQIAGLNKVRLLADRTVCRKKQKGSISPKFIKENISSMIREAIEKAADEGVLETQGKTLLKQFPHRREEISKILNDDNINALNEFAQECNGF